MNNFKKIGPCITIVENAIENTEKIISLAIEKSKTSGIDQAYIYDIVGNKDSQRNFRDTDIIDISPTYQNDGFWWLLAQKLWQYGDAYGRNYGVNFSNMEYPQFLWYKKNEGFYNPHIDSDRSNLRVFSSVLYLNDVEEGGETYFENFGISVKPKAGTLLMFPADFSYIHGAKTPLSNDKFSIVTWFNP